MSLSRTYLFRGLLHRASGIVTRISHLLERINSREFRGAVETLKSSTEAARKQAELDLQEEKLKLGSSICLKLINRFRAHSFDGYKVYPCPENGNAYSIFIRGKLWNGIDQVEDVVQIHIDLTQPSFPIRVRGLYSSGLLGEEEFFDKDSVQIAIMIRRICERIGAGGYLLKVQKVGSDPIDFVSLALRS